MAASSNSFSDDDESCILGAAPIVDKLPGAELKSHLVAVRSPTESPQYRPWKLVSKTRTRTSRRCFKAFRSAIMCTRGVLCSVSLAPTSIMVSSFK